MKFLGLAAAALLMGITASAGVVEVTCVSNSNAAGTNFFNTGSTPLLAATSSCANFSALPVGDNFGSVQIVLQADYQGGNGNTTNTTQTVFTGSLADLIQVTSAGSISGTGPAFAYTDESSCASVNPTCTPNFPTLGSNYFATTDAAANAGNYTALNISETLTTTVTAGSVQGVSEQAFVFLNYTTGTPEPGSMILLGSGLLAAGLIGRKKLVRK